MKRWKIRTYPTALREWELGIRYRRTIPRYGANVDIRIWSIGLIGWVVQFVYSD